MSKFKNINIVLLIIGIIGLIGGVFVYGFSSFFDEFTNESDPFFKSRKKACKIIEFRVTNRVVIYAIHMRKRSYTE